MDLEVRELCLVGVCDAAAARQPDLLEVHLQLADTLGREQPAQARARLGVELLQVLLEEGRGGAFGGMP